MNLDSNLTNSLLSRCKWLHSQASYSCDTEAVHIQLITIFASLKVRTDRLDGRAGAIRSTIGTIMTEAHFFTWAFLYGFAIRANYFDLLPAFFKFLPLGPRFVDLHSHSVHSHL